MFGKDFNSKKDLKGPMIFKHTGSILTCAWLTIVIEFLIAPIFSDPANRVLAV